MTHFAGRAAAWAPSRPVRTDVHFHLLSPPPQLSPWVASGIAAACADAAPGPLPACRFPALVEGGLTLVLDGRLHLPTACGPVPLPPCILSAASPAPMTLLRTPTLRCVGLRLHPAGIQALLGASPLALPHGMVDGADVFGPALAGLSDQLAACTSGPQAVRVLFAFVARQLQAPRHLERHRRARQLQAVAVQGAAPEQALGVSRRQYERVFLSTFGLPPKPFQRIARVEGLLRHGLRSTLPGAELALAHGYYDQSHMARELRDLVGAPLGVLRDAVAGADAAWWPLAAGTQAHPATR